MKIKLSLHSINGNGTDVVFQGTAHTNGEPANIVKLLWDTDQAINSFSAGTITARIEVIPEHSDEAQSGSPADKKQARHRR